MDHPFEEIVFYINYLASKGWECYQKFSCEKCHARLTVDEANTIYETGTCDQCGHVSDIRKNGCNYLAVGKNKSLPDLWRDQEEAAIAYGQRAAS